MKYIESKHIQRINIEWQETIEVIVQAINCLIESDYSQPKKLYLRYNNENNRIIAMPAYVGGGVRSAGIKWISSFPDNLLLGIPRAHSVIILNNADTGMPYCLINSIIPSVVRTASVSGFVIKEYIKNRLNSNKIIIGIIGLGPIGEAHINMCLNIFDEYIEIINIFDINPHKYINNHDSRINRVSKWQEAYKEADVLITCTVSSDRYINMKPKEGSLHLNTSLRDYEPHLFQYFNKSIIVDDWNEVCRENTDIDVMNQLYGLNEDMTYSIKDIITIGPDVFANKTIMFNPMGLAIFDVSMGFYILQKCLAINELVDLDKIKDI